MKNKPVRISTAFSLSWLMFWLIILSWFVSCMILSSCSKDPGDYRDKFTGKWSGTATYDIPATGWRHTRENRATIMKGSGTDELAISTLGVDYYAIAILDNDSYRYYPFEIGGTIIGCNITSLCTFRGRGWIKGDSLLEEGTMTLSSNGQVFSGTWQTRMKRR